MAEEAEKIDPSKYLIPNHLAVSFTESARFAGVEVKMFQANAFIATVMMLMFQMFWWIGVAVIFHFILRWATTAEPKMREVYIKYQFQGDHYEPWCGIPPSCNKRPIGFGRNESC